MGRSRHFLAKFAVCAIVVGCSDALSPATHVLKSPGQIERDFRALDGMSVGLPATPNTLKYLPIFPYSEGVSVEMSVSDRLFVTSTSDAWVKFNGLLDGGGVWDVDSQQQCSLRVFIYYPNIGNMSPPGCNPPTSATSWTDTIVVQGTGTVKRGGGIVDGPQCADGHCHTWSGSQTITITPLAADLVVTPSNVFLPDLQASRPQYTTFTIRAIPDTIKHQATPVKVVARSWQRADPTVAGADTTTPTGNCSLNTLYCNLPVKEAGTLTIRARANGVEHTVVACVQCVSSDALLNDQLVRDSLVDLSIRSNPSAPFSTHQEQVLMILESMYSHRVYTLPIRVTDPNPCFSKWTLPDPWQIPDSLNLIAFAHTHPLNSVGQSQICPGSGRRVGGPGGSIDFDWPEMQRWNSLDEYHQRGWFNIPMYIIANDFVYKMDPTKGPGSDKRPIMRWDKGRCAWVRL
jgi:hypothetical protein